MLPKLSFQEEPSMLEETFGGAQGLQFSQIYQGPKQNSSLQEKITSHTQPTFHWSRRRVGQSSTLEQKKTLNLSSAKYLKKEQAPPTCLN